MSDLDLNQAVSTIVDRVADLERHPYDLACPFGCTAPARSVNDPHADDCPITLAQRVMEREIVERRPPAAPKLRIGRVDR